MSTQLDNPSFDDTFFEQSLPQIYRSVLRQFRKTTSSFVLFNVLAVSLFTAELLLLFAFLPFQSSLLAISLSGLFLTLFSYFVLLFYFQSKKPEQFEQLKTQFLTSTRQMLSVPRGETQHHLTIAAALSKLASYLDEFEWQIYTIPALFQPIRRLLSALFARWHSQDVFRFKQLLLHAAIDEHLQQLRFTPTDLELHASLASTYIALSNLFAESKHTPAVYRKRKELFEARFLTAARLAIEEFQILNHYAPNDPWVHEQLAKGYRDLHLPQEEIKEVETLLRLRPHDRELVLRLGALYFEQGLNAKGLRLYEELKQANFKKAEDLIAAYGTLNAGEIL